MRLAWVLVAALMACGDDSGDGDAIAPDAMPDAPNLAEPVAVEFTPLAYSVRPSPPTELTIGPDGRVYGLVDNQLTVSTDGGLTFTPVATATRIAGLVATGGALLGRDAMLVAPVLKRSTDNGVTFETVTVPGLEADDRLFIAAAGADLWVQPAPTAGPTVLLHSTDDGATFTELALPAASPAAWSMATGPGTLVIGNSVGTFRTTPGGTGWEELGTPGNFPRHDLTFVTAAGTVLAISSGGFHRRAAGATAWTSTVTTGAIGAIVQRPDGQLVRVQTATGTIETSDDDGVTWSVVPGVGWQGCQLASLEAFAIGLVGTCVDLSTARAIRLLTGASNWVIEEITGLPPPQIAKVADIAFADDGTVALAGRSRLYLSRDGGTTWGEAPWRPDDTMPLRAVAIAPDGRQMFVGSTGGRYAFLDATGTVIQESVVGELEEDIIQADYVYPSEVLVTTSEPQFTAGSVWQGNPDRVSTWLSVNPYRLESNPQFDPTAGFLGVAACGDVVAVGIRRWFGTNAWNNELRVKFQFPDFNALWFDIELPAVGALPVTAMSCAPNGTIAFSFVNEVDSQLWVGGFQGLGVFRKVTSTSLPSGILTAKFAPDDHLWVVTGTGVFRSTTPVRAL